MSGDLLNVIASVIGSTVWPVAIVTLLVIYRKPVRRVIEAVAQRIPQMEEVAGPAGMSAKFALNAKIGEMAREIPSRDIDGSMSDEPATVSPSEMNAPMTPERDAVAPPPVSEDELESSRLKAIDQVLSVGAEREIEARFVKLITDYSMISPAVAIEEAYRSVEGAVASLISPSVPIALQALPAGQELVQAFGLSEKDGMILDELSRVWAESKQQDPNSITDEAVAQYAQIAFYLMSRIRERSSRRTMLLNMIKDSQQ